MAARARDIAALWRRARNWRRLARRSPSPAEQIAAGQAPTPTRHAWRTRSVIRAGSRYSPAGYRRIVALANELTVLRGISPTRCPTWSPRCAGCWVSTAKPERRSRCTAGGRAEHLDAFTDVVNGYAERATTSPALCPASVAGLLAYLDTAAVVENGLPPPSSASPRPGPSAHGACGKGVGVAGGGGAAPVDRVFPSTASTRTWLTDAADLPPLLRATARRRPARCPCLGHLGSRQPKTAV
ncbi:putative ATP-dependent DNA helicase domain protein [Mycobacterium xenopi 4042]|uniref:Putative ATP-dependent DNA helicase domain protein n=1 Tax=Mycobacterium xenopi 4042 TaxID=1299334 RepID=X7YIK3_MYCXE|nr:putative ATP-dependent DNA helicase domain protein [Mycobacterium xenopi 4042]